MYKWPSIRLGLILIAGIAVGAAGTLVLIGDASVDPASAVAESAPAAVGTPGGSATDWCSEHRVPESECTACNPELVASFKANNDWCGEHGLPESHCRLCNPGLAFAQQPVSALDMADWCNEHRVPESACTICNPELVAKFKASNDWCGEHGLPESHCRLCNPGLTFAQEPPPVAAPVLALETSVFFPPNRVECATNNAIIQFAAPETANRAGLSVEPALEAVESASVEAPAELLFDETRTFAVTTTVPATVLRWLLEPGRGVAEGEEFAELQSPDMAALKAEYLEARSEFQLEERNRARADSMHQRKLISAAELEQAAAAAVEAQSHLQGANGLLRAAGLSDEDISALEEKQEITSRWFLRAPVDGYLLERKAPLGELLAAGTGLALVGDPSALWIEAHVREHDLPKFRAGQQVEFNVDGGALGRASGRVFWASQYVDPETRTGTVRAKLEGKAAAMRAHRFGKLLLHESDSADAVAVPMDAVQWEGCCNVVFVQETIDRYRPRKVTIERGSRGYYNVTSGVQTGEMVVVRGSYLLKTELKKSSLGAGCCGIDAKS